jgi:hypothetical protein
VRANHDLSRVSVSFDETNFVPNAGLLSAAVLAQRLDLAGLVDERLHLASHGANIGAKALSVIGSMLAGGDSIDDVAVLRAGAAASLFDGTRAPSTVGSWLRAHKWSNVRQLDAISRELLVRLWAAGAGPTDLSAPLTIDLDSTIVEVHGRAKQGAAFGTRKFAATTRSSRPASRPAMLATAAKFDVRFSITARQDKRICAAIDAIPDDAWHPIPYWLSTPEVSGADIADTAFTVFASDKRHARQVRLVVRRVRPTPGSQLALFTNWDYRLHHRPRPAAGRTRGRPPPARDRRADHRRAQERWPGAPAGNFMANAAWLALTVMAHNLGRAIGQLAGSELERATAATLRRKVFTMPGRLVHTGRRRHLRLPASWPWANPIQLSLSRITAIPLRC